jgi:hypothetical protein
METEEVKDERLDHGPSGDGKVEVPEETSCGIANSKRKKERADPGENEDGELRGAGKKPGYGT